MHLRRPCRLGKVVGRPFFLPHWSITKLRATTASCPSSSFPGSLESGSCDFSKALTNPGISSCAAALSNPGNSSPRKRFQILSIFLLAPPCEPYRRSSLVQQKERQTTFWCQGTIRPPSISFIFCDTQARTLGSGS